MTDFPGRFPAGSPPTAHRNTYTDKHLQQGIASDRYWGQAPDICLLLPDIAPGPDSASNVGPPLLEKGEKP